jgi:predicted acetyltransferase
MKTMLNPVIKRAELKDKGTIKNLMQFYFYDFSEFVEAYVGNDGLFDEYSYLNAYWEEKERFPYLIEKDGKIAGFIFVREVQEEGKHYWSIAEFFIMKKFRLSGLGKHAAHQVFQIIKGIGKFSRSRRTNLLKLFGEK